MIDPFYKELASFGALGVIGVHFLKAFQKQQNTFLEQQKILLNKTFENQEKTVDAIARVTETLKSHNFLKGKSLLMMLDLKIESLRWGIQKKIINYIVKNNIKDNYDVIVREIILYIDEKKQNFFITLKDITEITVLKIEMKLLNEELENTKDVIINLLNELKEDGLKDKALYETTKRIVETHFEHFENRMKEKQNETFN